MLTQQTSVSRAVLKVNFMDPMKKADRIAECRSKAYNREYRDENIGLPVEVHDGVNLRVKFDDAPEEDVTTTIVGSDAQVRFSKQQWEALNERFHNMKGIGAFVEVVVKGNVAYGDLTVNGEEVQSFTIYVETVEAVEPMTIARVGSTTTRDDFFKKVARDKKRKSSKADEARAMSRAAREGAKKDAPSSRKTAKV